MRTWRRVVIAAAILGTAFLFYRWWQSASARVQRRPESALDPDDSVPSLTAAAATRTTRSDPEAPDPAGARSSPTLDRARADRMRQQIHAFLAEAGPWGLAAAASAHPTPGPAGSFPTMPLLLDAGLGTAQVDPGYIQKRVREDLFPLAKDCYADALKRDPTVAGTLAVFFRIIGDHKVGGVIDEARMTEDTTIADPEFQTCVRESLMSVSFDAPPDDGEVTVVYPIRFAPDDDEAGAQR
jgi:hypothetical protein